jgi:hypothetical protein
MLNELPMRNFDPEDPNAEDEEYHGDDARNEDTNEDSLLNLNMKDEEEKELNPMEEALKVFNEDGRKQEMMNTAE